MKQLFFTLTLMCAVLLYPLAAANSAAANNKETGMLPKVGDLAQILKCNISTAMT